VQLGVQLAEDGLYKMALFEAIWAEPVRDGDAFVVVVNQRV
jgi:hypothetical protein